LTYERIGTELQADLVPVCSQCHKLIHFLVSDPVTIRQATEQVKNNRAYDTAPTIHPKHERPPTKEKPLWKRRGGSGNSYQAQLRNPKYGTFPVYREPD
jgi:hypothetical protein